MPVSGGLRFLPRCAIGIDRAVVITALSGGRKLNCPQLTSRERSRLHKHQRRAARAPKDSPQKSAGYAKASRIKANEVGRRKDWREKTSTMLTTSYDVIRFEKPDIVNMTASARGTVQQPGRNVAQKAGLNRAILAQGRDLLRRRTEDKAPHRRYQRSGSRPRMPNMVGNCARARFGRRRHFAHVQAGLHLACRHFSWTVNPSFPSTLTAPVFPPSKSPEPRRWPVANS